MLGRLRPSPAMVVATLALMVALGGTGIAAPVARIAKSISGSTIKAHSIAGSKLKNNTLTGRQIKESRLGTVPAAKNAAHASSADKATSATTAVSATTAATANSATTAVSATTAATADRATTAASADSAAQAADAATVDGMTVRKIFYAPSANTVTPTTILSIGGLSLNATCNSGTISITIKSAVDHAHFTSQMWNAAGGTGGADGLRRTDFNTTTNDDLTDGNDWGETSFTYTQPNGTIVVGEVSFDSDSSIGGNIFNHSAKCLASGVATSTASS